MKQFRVVRLEDESGVSGTGIVAEGVEFDDGQVVFEWKNDENPDVDTMMNGLTFKPGVHGVHDLEEIHGHGGRTRLEWLENGEYVRDKYLVEE